MPEALDALGALVPDGADEARAFGISVGVGAGIAGGILLLGIVPGAPLHDTIKDYTEHA